MDRTMSTLATGGLVAVILGFAFREIGENLLGPEAGRVHPQRRRHHCGIPSPGGLGAAGTGPEVRNSGRRNQAEEGGQDP
jgi:hypothetical protein